MSFESFNKLASKLKPFMHTRHYAKASANGPIFHTVRLACAIRYFAGGASYDICAAFGISYTEVFASVWEVVDALNKCPEFAVQYPSCHQKQNEIAMGFRAKSSADFDCCAGAVDGLLIWTHKPSAVCCNEAGCDAAKFFCGRKHKFGLNLQAICDSEGRFLDVSILYPGSTADCLAFEGMSIYKRLQDGLLAPGLCLFGDNAYLNVPFMATPFAGRSISKSKDAYNYYHSQLRIEIECSFGKFTQRWGILRSALPKKITVKKSVSMILALTRLHNFCIDERQPIEEMTARDACHIEREGAVPMEVDGRTDVLLPTQLIGGGDHFEGVPRSVRRRVQRSFEGIQLPRDRLHARIMDLDLQRPMPRSRV
jgi:DDE superfamily endonuclease